MHSTIASFLYTGYPTLDSRNSGMLSASSLYLWFGNLLQPLLLESTHNGLCHGHLDGPVVPQDPENFIVSNAQPYHSPYQIPK